MNFSFSEEQELLRSEVERFLEARTPMNRIRALAAEAPGHDRNLWKELAELGWAGLLIPEEFGGAGLGWLDAVVLLETTGRRLLPQPLLSTLLASWAVREHASSEQAARWLPPVARGEAVATTALVEGSQRLDPEGVGVVAAPDGPDFRLSGDKFFVHDVQDADWIVVSARGPEGVLLGVLEREGPGVEIEPRATIDPTKRTGRLCLRDARLPRASVIAEGERGGAACVCLLDAGALGCAAEMLGAADAAHALAVAHAKQRAQFGGPIGRFQGVKHPLAESHVAIETARSLVYYAGWALDSAPDEVPRAASMAKAYVSDTFARMGVECIQLYGAIGYTDECDAQLYFKRSKWARPAFGDASHHYERVAALRGLSWTSA